MVVFDKILIFLMFFPIVGIFILFVLNFREHRMLKIFALNNSCICFIGFLIIWSYFDKSESNFQFYNKLILVPFLNLNLSLGVDGISLFFVILNCLLIPICLLTSWNAFLGSGSRRSDYESCLPKPKRRLNITCADARYSC